jgi:hypothetical protein
MKYLVGIPCLLGADHTRMAIESVVYKSDTDLLLIDNGSEASVKELIRSYEHLPNVIVIHNPINIYVNPAWNQILKHFLDNKQYSHVMIMNSDLVLHKEWLTMLDLYFREYPTVIPLPVMSDNAAILHQNIPFVLKHHEVNQGTPGALIVLNRQHAEAVYPIPSYIKVWFGDNWIFEILRALDYKTIVVDNFLSYHSWSQNVSRVPGIAGIIEEDKKQWGSKGEKDKADLIHKLKNKLISS